MNKSTTIIFGEFELDVVSGQLTGSKQGHRLSPKAVEVLLCLAKNGGDVVSKETLHSTVWAGRIVSDAQIAKSIYELRTAFGDHSYPRRYIETLSKRGYRLLCNIYHPTNTTTCDEVAETNPHDPADRDSTTQVSAQWVKPGFAIFILIVVGWFVYNQPTLVNTTQQLPGEASQSIAILPFRDMSPAGDQDYFSNGVADELRNELQGLDGLRVASRLSTISLKQNENNPSSIGAVLGVSFILEGSIRKDGDRIRITAQLINTADGFQIWSETYNRQLVNIFEAQKEIAASVAGALGVRLGVGGINAFPGSGTQNVEAYEKYLKAMQLGKAGGQHTERMELLSQATLLDPNYAAAWAAYGLTIASTMWVSLPEEAPAILNRAYLLVTRAIDLYPESAQAHALHATILYPQMKWIAAEEAYKQAFALSTRRSLLAQRGNMLMRTGRSSAARAVYDDAELLESWGGRPSNLRWHVSLAQSRYADTEKNLAWHDTASRLQHQLEIALNRGRIDKVKAAIRALPELAISKTLLYIPVLRVFDTPDTVLSTLHAIHADKRKQWPSKLNDIALLAAYFGDAKFALATKAEEVRNTPVRMGAIWYPVMSDTRRLPEFKTLMTKINMVAYWRTHGWADVCRPLGQNDFECR